MASSRVILIIVSVNKMIEKQAKRVKGYLRLRGVIQTKHIKGAWFLLFLGGLLGGFLGGFLDNPGFLGSFRIILLFTKVRLRL